ncbi:MAG TPA: hypothetical protein VKX28_26945 [Xanthobacteraceae bacterium]|nr:hypothetical protein [Xanthobacteraceae bacterium]
MSGRVSVTLADGRHVVGYRKTLRRNARRTPQERRRALLAEHMKPAGEELQVGFCFVLPGSIAPFTAPGRHGIGVLVTKTDHMVVLGKSSDHCLYLIRAFLRGIAEEKPGWCAAVTVASNERPDAIYERHLLVLAGIPALCNGNDPPKWCEAA